MYTKLIPELVHFVSFASKFIWDHLYLSIFLSFIWNHLQKYFLQLEHLIELVTGSSVKPYQK